MKSSLWSLLCVCAVASLVFQSEAAAKKEKAARFEMSVDGGGFFRNRSIKGQLLSLFGENKKMLEASDIEDGALIALSSLQSEGYLNAEMRAEILTAKGEVVTGQWDKTFNFFLPRGLRAEKVDFELMLGPRFYFESLEINGNSVLENEAIEEFFYSSGFLLSGKKSHVFTKSGFSGGVGNLQRYLMQLGYQEAKVTSTILNRNDETGGIEASVTVAEGSRYYVDTIVVDRKKQDVVVASDFETYRDKVFSRFVMQDIAKALRNAYYEQGYPDASVQTKFSVAQKKADRTLVEIKISVDAGKKRTVSVIDFRGYKETRRRVLERQLELHEGDPLNPIDLEKTRVELSRLGVFKRVDYTLDHKEDGLSDLTFELEERYPWTVDLIAGWGSYEQLRGGVIAERINVFGKTHRVRFKGFASMKSLLSDVRYLIPDLWKSDTSLSSKLFTLSREEASFEREEFGFDIGLSKHVKEIDMDTDLVYTLQTLEPRANQLGGGLGNQGSIEVGSLELRLGRERRDNPLSPQKGYRLSGLIEYADNSLGGTAEYQRLELGYSMHGRVSNGRYWHLGFTHGGIASFDTPNPNNPDGPEDPANKLFFLGGENTIRGYTRGDASPKDGVGADAKDIGAKSFALLNLELEQLLSEKLSVVLFGDALGQSAERYDFEYDYLYSVGLGLRLKTFMGPIRFEYGRNVDPRPSDPKGSFHFSIGYPF